MRKPEDSEGDGNFEKLLMAVEEQGLPVSCFVCFAVGLLTRMICENEKHTRTRSRISAGMDRVDQVACHGLCPSTSLLKHAEIVKLTSFPWSTSVQNPHDRSEVCPSFFFTGAFQKKQSHTCVVYHLKNNQSQELFELPSKLSFSQLPPASHGHSLDSGRSIDVSRMFGLCVHPIIIKP